MLRHGARCRCFSVSTKKWSFDHRVNISRLDQMKLLDVDNFRTHFFKPGLPATLPAGCFEHLPAVNKWFTNARKRDELNVNYLREFKDTIVPIELYRAAVEKQNAVFHRSALALGDYMNMMEELRDDQSTRVYLAQCPIADLPPKLRADLPTPDLVKLAGTGDVYDSSIWLGEAPTFTPLHKDPNPNLFVQLCGTKVVRLVQPSQGEALLHKARNTAPQNGAGSAIRGDEMMAGKERDALERLVWDPSDSDLVMFEAELEAGDGVFIPKGWWHSIKGIGQGMIGSVSLFHSYSVFADSLNTKTNRGSAGQLVVSLMQRFMRPPS